MSRKPSCTCGNCNRCKARVAARAAYQSLSVEQRRDLVAGRDPEKARAADRARYVRDKAKRRAAARAYAQTEAGRDALRRSKAAWAARNPEKRKAQQAVGNALRDGRLIRGPCEHQGNNCRGRVHAHHDDYSKPLEVRWLCAGHHAEHHKLMRLAADAASEPGSPGVPAAVETLM